MSNVITFPGSMPPSQTVADLPAGTAAILVQKGAGEFVASMVPAPGERERRVRKTFPDAGLALRYARLMILAYPGLYRFVIDATGDGPSSGRAA